MKKRIIVGLLSLVVMGSFQTTQVLADTSTPTSIIDQIEHPNRGTDLNNNGSRNWKMSNHQYLIQATTNGEIPYKITATDPYYQKIWTDAVNAWNQLGVIKFVPVTGNAQVTLGGSPNSNTKTDWYGITGDEILNDATNPQIGYMRNCRAKLAGKLVNKPSHYQLNLMIAEHELGHTLGFAHDDSHQKGKYHIMHDGIGLPFVKRIQPLGEYEKQTLLKYYQPGQTRQPSSGFLY